MEDKERYYIEIAVNMPLAIVDRPTRHRWWWYNPEFTQEDRDNAWATLPKFDVNRGRIVELSEHYA